MELPRRKVLAILGVGGVAAGGYVVSQRPGQGSSDDESDDPDESDGNPDAQSKETLDISTKVAESMSSVPERPPALSFDYGSVDVDVEESELLSQLTAETNFERSGDQLAITAEGRAASETIALFRDIWNVSNGISVDAEVDGDDVTFTGGTASDTTYLLGASSADADVVYVARGETPETAKRLATSFGDFSR